MRHEAHIPSGEGAGVLVSSASPKPILRKHLGFLDRVPIRQHPGVPKRLQIRCIDAIGVIYNNAAGLDPCDQLWISRAFAFFQENNLLVSRHVRIRPWDLATGHDILTAPSRLNSADAWILCWVWNPRSAKYLNADPDSNKRSSPRHFEDGVWRETAREAGIKVIVSFSNKYGPGHHKIRWGNYKTELDSRAFVGGNNIKGPAYEFRMERNGNEVDVVMETTFGREYSQALCDSAFGTSKLRSLLLRRLKRIARRQGTT